MENSLYVTYIIQGQGMVRATDYHDCVITLEDGFEDFNPEEKVEKIKDLIRSKNNVNSYSGVLILSIVNLSKIW
tara:strand:- start:1638 stop:1859 length:222 start_codon:yes stop_codon:yes gene_type:complete